MSDYKVSTDDTITVNIWIARSGKRYSVLQESQYEFLKRATDEVKAHTDDRGILDPDFSVPAIYYESMPIDQYACEWAKFLPTSYGLDARVITEGSTFSPFVGSHTDNVAVRNAKIKYLLREWSLDIPLKRITADDVEQLHKTTIREIEDVASEIIYGFLIGYDQLAFGG